MTKDRVSGFLLLVLSLAYFLAAYQIELYPGSEEDFINAQTFPKAIGLAAILFAFLIMVMPGKDDEGFASWKLWIGAVPRYSASSWCSMALRSNPWVSCFLHPSS